MEQTIQELEIVIRARVDEALSGIKQVTDAIKGKVSQSTNEIKKVQQVSQSVAKQSSSAFSQMFGKKEDTGVQENVKQIEYLKSKIEELKFTLQNVDDLKLEGTDVLKVEAQIETLEKRLRKLNQETKKQPSLWNRISSAIKKAKSSTNGIGDNLSKSFNKGLKTIKKFTLSLLTVRSAFSMVSRASREYLSMDEELNSQITNSWRLLGTLLKPALETIIGLFNTAVSSVLTFVQALTGINFVANANAKALKNQAKANAGANKQLSGIDDINSLSSSSGGGASTDVGVKLGEVDTSAIEGYVKKIKEAFETGGWYEVGATIGKSISDGFKSFDVEQFIEKGKTVGKALSDGINGFFGENGIDAKEIGNKVSDTIDGLIDIVFEFIDNVDWASIGKKVGDFLLSIDWVSILGKLFILLQIKLPTLILKFILGLGDSILDAIKNPEFWKKLIESGVNVIKGIIEGFLEMIKTIGDVFLKIIDIFKALFGIHSPSTVFAEFGKYIIEGLINGIKAIIGTVADIFTALWNSIKKGASVCWDGIKNAFSKMKSFFSSVFNGVWSVVKGIINSMIKGFETMINSVIKGLNLLLKPLTKVGNTILKAVGINSFSFTEISKVTIPKLATGNVATKPTMAMFGEYAGATSNPEITAPQKTMEASFRKVLAEQNNNNGTPQRLVVQVGANTLFDDMIDYANNKSQRNGVSVFTDI